MAELVSWDDARTEFVRLRGVETPCSRCQGMGTKAYGSTATWRGGIGGQAITTDVCDVCWGTGDENRKGADLRAMAASEARRVAERAANLWAERTGAHLSVVRPALREVAGELERLSRSRKPRARWFADTCGLLARTLRELSEAAEHASRGTPR